jgi:pimeloyl-ACP methyl ester carboxylesterase
VLPTVEGLGVELAYAEHGSGQAVLLIHGMADDAAGAQALLPELSEDARVVAYDRRGYGSSGAPDVYERTSVQEQAEDAVALLRALDAAPAIACAWDFGALVALDLLVRHPALLQAAVLVSPPLFALVPEAAEALSAERLMLEEALREDGPAGAVERWLAATASVASPERVTRARRAHRAFFADLGGLATWPGGRRELREIEPPLRILSRPGQPPHVEAAARALKELAPNAELVAGDPQEAVRDLIRRARGSRSPEAPRA